MELQIFRERLKALIENNGLTVKELAPEIGLSAASISRYIAALRTPDLASVIKIADFFNVSIDWLLGYSNDRYETLPDNIRDIISLYSVASADDRKIIDMILGKYKTKE